VGKHHFNFMKKYFDFLNARMLNNTGLDAGSRGVSIRTKTIKINIGPP
jgi:hypothetical protein